MSSRVCGGQRGNRLTRVGRTQARKKTDKLTLPAVTCAIWIAKMQTFGFVG